MAIDLVRDPDKTPSHEATGLRRSQIVADGDNKAEDGGASVVCLLIKLWMRCPCRSRSLVGKAARESRQRFWAEDKEFKFARDMSMALLHLQRVDHLHVTSSAATLT